jgi:hypothetical protein
MSKKRNKTQRIIAFGIIGIFAFTTVVTAVMYALR